MNRIQASVIASWPAPSAKALFSTWACVSWDSRVTKAPCSPMSTWTGTAPGYSRRVAATDPANHGATGRRDGGVHHRHDRDVEFRGDAEEQTELLRLHGGRHRYDKAITLPGHALPQSFELVADEVGRRQVAEAVVGQRLGAERVPEGILNEPRFQPRVAERGLAGHELAVFQEGETGFAVQDSAITDDGDPGIVDMDGQQGHGASPAILALSPPACGG